MGFAPLFDLYATFVDVSGLPSYVAPNGVLHMVSHILSVCFESSTRNSVGAGASWKGPARTPHFGVGDFGRENQEGLYCIWF